MLLATTWWGGHAQASDLTGTVRLAGSVPEPTLITLTAKGEAQNLSACHELQRPSSALIVDPEGGVRHALVWIEPHPEPLPVSAAGVFAIDQQGCAFTPHILVVPSGSQVEIRNSDPIDHNVRIYDGATLSLHLDQGPGDPPVIWPAEHPGRYVLRCGLHHWMYSWIVVVDHPPHYAVSGVGGRFAIPGVPPGQYRLRIWHETLGELDQPILVNSANRPITLTYPAQHKEGRLP